MPHLELSFDLSGLDPDRAEAACFDRGALAITLTDTRDDPVLEPAPGEVRLWPATRVQALFPAEADSDQLRTGLRQALGIAAVDAKLIEDKPWEREWLRDFHAMRFGERLWICPQHEQVTQPDAVIVKLDPGLAFGTGTHPSTALCLTWLDAHGRAGALAGARVMDYGCGSGVLGIAAAKLGASVQVWDIDPQALLATEQNAAANDVAAQVGVRLEEQQLAGGTDLLIANILANILCELAPRFAELVRVGGALLLAGILESQAETVTAACAPWFDMEIAGQRESWVSLSGTRKQHVHSLS